jgi:hypothetical protein
MVLTGSRLMSLDADEAEIDGSLVLEGVQVHGSDDQKMIRLINARIGGELDFEDAQISNESGPAVRADGIRVGNSLFLRGANVVGSGDQGVIRLISAHVGGDVTGDNVRIANDTGPALDADGLRADGDFGLQGAEICGVSEDGAIHLGGARIGGQLSFTRANITNDSGPALTAEGLQVDGDLFLREVTVRGAGTGGAIRLTGVRATGQLDFEAARITNYSGPALTIDSLRGESDLSLCRVQVHGCHSGCAISLGDAHVAGQLDFEAAKITNYSGLALRAEGIHVDGDVFLRRLHAHGSGADCTIVLIGAYVGGQFDCTGLWVKNRSGPRLDLGKARVDGTVLLPAGVICAERRSDTGSCPYDAVVGLDGFTFTDLGQLNWRQWLHLIHCHTPAYRPQPYQQLAAIERNAGNDGNARHVVITQQHDLRHRAPDAVGAWPIRRVHWLWGALAGYGYRARRTAIALFLAVIAAGALGYAAGAVTTRPGHHAAERTVAGGSPVGTPCSSVELIGLGLDRGLPLGPTGLRTRCDLDTGTRRGQLFTVAVWIVQAIIWGLATLALAGFTNLIRKTP